MTDSSTPIRVVVQQASLAKYRVPVFRELAGRDDIQLELLYGVRRGIPSVPATGFSATEVRFREIRLLGHPLYWHQAQLQAASRRRADVAILSWDAHYASLIPALTKAKLQGVPAILWGHGYSKRETVLRRSVRNSFLRLSSALLLYNHTTREAFCRQGYDRARLFVAPNSLDQQPIAAARALWSQQRLQTFRQQQQLAQTPLLLYVSRLVPANRVHLLIEATARLSSRGLAVATAIVGDGEPEQSRLQALARRLGVAEQVRFLGALYDEEALAPWFLSSSLFVYPANIGLSVLHAFGYGLPVVTSDNLEQQNPEIEAAEDGCNAFFYRDGDLDSLVDTLAAVLTDPDRLAAARGAAERTVRERFNIQRMVDGMEAAIRFCATA